MFKISKKIEYALMALQYLWKNPSSMTRSSDFVSVRGLCDELKIPFDTTSKVLQMMQTKGIVEAERGNHGGYRLSINLDEITFLQLCEWIEKKRFGIGHQCDGNGTGDPCEYKNSCNIEAPINHLSDVMIHFFGNFSVEDVLASKIPLELKSVKNIEDKR